MSTTNNLPTRQQLEEIDALLKRMLSLPPLAAESRDDGSTSAPVTAAEVSPTPTAYAEPRIQSWRVEWPTPTPSASTAMPPVAPIPVHAPVAAPTPTPAPATVAAWGSPVTPSAPATPSTHSRFTVYTPPVVPQTAETIEQPRPYVSPPFSPAYPPGYAPQAYPTTPIPAVAPAPNQRTQTQPEQVFVVERRSAWLFPIVALNWVYDILTYLLPMGSWWRSSGRVWMGRAAVLMFLTAAGWAAGEWQGVEWPKADLNRINLSRFGWAK